MTSFFRILLSAILIVFLLYSRAAFPQDIYPASRFSEVAVFPGLTAPAIVISLEETELSTQITARVDKVLTDVGSDVQEGEVLLTLECDDYELGANMAKAQLLASEANLELMKNRHSRSTRLMKQKLTSEEDVDATAANLAAANADRDKAKAAFDIAELDKSRCQVTAPFNGSISARYASKGQLATDRAPLFNIINHNNLEVSAQVNEKNIKTLNEQTLFTFVGLSDYPLELKRTVQSLDNKTRAQELRLGFAGEYPLPGSAGKISWTSSIPHLSRKYLTTENGMTGYFTAVDGIARFIALGNMIPEKDYPADLSADTIVITGNLQSLSDGDPVRIEVNEPLTESVIAP